MKLSALFFAAGAFAAGFSASVPARADEAPGVCTIQPADLLGTFGFSASGTNLTANFLIPAGVFSQEGTATGKTAAWGANKTITGTWSNTLTQNDTSGNVTTVTFTGPFTVNATTCEGDFFWNVSGATTPVRVFHAVFVNHATEFRSIATLPGVIIAYSGKKL